MDIVGIVLTAGETLKAVCSDLFRDGEVFPQQCEEGNCLSCKPCDPVENDLVGDLELPCDGPDPRSAV